MDDDLVASFMGITGASEHVARQILELANGDMEQAAVLFYDTDMAEALQRQPATAGTTTTETSATRTRTAARPQTTAHANGPSNAIRIDSDDDFDALDDDDDEIEEDDDDVVMTGHRTIGDDTADAAAVARSAQEEEDEAMAKRLQEEMYAERPGGGGSGTGMGDDDVRAPMGRTTEMLVEPSYGGGGFSDYGSSIFEQMRRQRQRAVPNPFNQVWDNDPAHATGAAAAGVTGTDGGSGSGSGSSTSRQARLADLFRPPYDLMEHLTWDEAREVGKAEKRWILANLQDMSDFQCQALNRDIWKDEAVRQLVRAHFVFLQYGREDVDAEPYIQYYMPGGQHENPDNYPHVGIVDPRTGEQVKVWSGRPFPTASAFHAQLAEFLDRYSLDAARKNPVQRTKATRVVKDVGRMTEDEMLEMALRNSLETGGVGSSGGSGVHSSGVASSPAEASGVSSSRAAIQDPDELTGTPAPAADENETGANGADNADGADDADDAGDTFARIASDRPHEEPANGGSVTRIQFRHPTGRVIRRFAVDDRVERLYEWLKAAPLEGTTGRAFELKVMPQGHDLLEDLDKTIEAAGLKQATVAIEFL